ncbi:hypothetical protein [Limnohabitans sp. DM1]|uniref:hypothetical protein n=1 Tax=Limnohabitans sp. DM1 TaxID=1597955 RepID=UPI000AE90755|nr:hypothetical protein [Limnohabitans sp. DM1]
MQDQNNEAIKKKLKEFEDHIDAYRGALNTEGVWLFLATLGCWSVGHAPSQLYAITITFILFSHRIYSKLHDKRPFSSIIKDLEKIIKKELENGDTQKARLHDLHQIRDIKLATKSQLKSTIIFLLCYSFLALTLWNCYKSAIH